jgi:hypothetical protein
MAVASCGTPPFCEIVCGYPAPENDGGMDLPENDDGQAHPDLGDVGEAGILD